MRLAILDTETTGIPSRHPTARVVEVAAVVIDWTGGACTEVATFDSLARPDKDEHRLPVSAEALRFNGLTIEQVDAAPPDWAVGQALEGFLLHYRVDGIGAFNADFDFDPLLLGGGRWLGRYLRGVFHLPCLMIEAKTRMGLDMYARGGRLTEACKHFGVPVLDAHKALADARMAAGLVPHVYDFDALSKAVAPFVPFIGRPR